jgi:hypothetical protein
MSFLSVQIARCVDACKPGWVEANSQILMAAATSSGLSGARMSFKGVTPLDL